MTGGTETSAQTATLRRWMLELLLPGLFTLILGACLVHMACCALQAQWQPVAGFHYAISAFAL